MSNTDKRHQKSILSDPIAAFRLQGVNDSEHDVEKLRGLWKAYREQQEHYEETRDLGRAISRKIGDAKRSGQPVDHLKNQMQNNSTQVKTISQRVQELETKILAFFPTPDVSSDANIKKDSSNTVSSSDQDMSTQKCRNYPGIAEHNQDIIISLLSSDQQKERLDWNHYVESNPAASIYHRTEWQELIHTTFGHEGLYFLARDVANNIVGILPLIRLKSRLFGDFLVSMPYFNYGGAVADSPDIEKLLMEAANRRADSLGVTHIEYRDDIPRAGLPARTDKVNMILPLPDNEDKLWQGFTTKLRAQIKRPQREDTQVLIGGSELLEEFYQVFARNMRDLGTPVYGQAFFYNILQTFPSKSRIIVLRLAKRPVAAAFLLGFGDTLEIPWASTIREVNHLSMNMLMYWEVLQYAVKNDFRYFDFGRSSKDSGTYRFKQQWGARPKPLYWHYWLPDGVIMPTLNPNNPKYALMIAVWKRLPVFVSRLLGPRIVKNLP